MIVYQRFKGSGGLSCNTQVNTTNFKDPRIKNPGVFCFYKGKMEQIDYAKLNERIVEQAYEGVLGEMSKEQLQKLIQDKFERARKYHEALAKAPTFSVN
jgi:hypothetical protein